MTKQISEWVYFLIKRIQRARSCICTLDINQARSEKWVTVAACDTTAQSRIPRSHLPT